jgi:hypothetical protein
MREEEGSEEDERMSIGRDSTYTKIEGEGRRRKEGGGEMVSK